MVSHCFLKSCHDIFKNINDNFLQSTASKVDDTNYCLLTSHACDGAHRLWAINHPVH